MAKFLDNAKMLTSTNEREIEMEKLFNRINEEDGISAFVILGNRGKFHAIYRDDDSGNNISIVICPTIELAIDKCKGFF